MFILSYVLLNISKDSLRVLVNSLIIHISNFISHIYFSRGVGIFMGNGERLPPECWPVIITVRFPCTILFWTFWLWFPSLQSILLLSILPTFPKHYFDHSFSLWKSLHCLQEKLKTPEVAFRARYPQMHFLSQSFRKLLFQLHSSLFPSTAS